MAVSYSEWLFDRINAITILKSLQSKVFFISNYDCVSIIKKIIGISGKVRGYV